MSSSSVPDFCCGGDNRNSVLLPSLGFRRAVPGAGVVQSCTWHGVYRGFRFLSSFFFNALAAASSICWYGMVWYGMVWYGMVEVCEVGILQSFS